MTLDPVHVDEIAALARLIERDVDDDEHDDFAERVWTDFLDPLRHDGRVVLEPVEEQARRRARIDEIALSPSPFPTRHGIDAGTINPTTFHNGAVIDVAHAAMAREPSDHELHRRRSIVGTIHLNDRTVAVPDEWVAFDDGYGRRKWLQAPRVRRFAEGVVHTLSLYHAESEHATSHLDQVDDILVLDGPIYPKEILRWEDRHRELRDRLVSDVLPGKVVQSYVDLVATALGRELPLLGFVKNPSSNRLTRAIRDAGKPAPWFNDAAFFRHVLDPTGAVDRPQDHLAFTNWFVSRAGTDRAFAEAGGRSIDLSFEEPAWRFEVTFMAVYDPRDGIVYRAEAPRGVTADPDARERLTRLLLREIAAERGPPRAVRKADRLARIGRGEKRSLRRAIESEWDTTVDRTYDDLRWGIE